MFWNPPLPNPPPRGGRESARSICHDQNRPRRQRPFRRLRVARWRRHRAPHRDGLRPARPPPPPALHTAKGCAMHVVCLSFGGRGESEKLWRQKGITLEAVKAARRKEAESAAEVLGVAQMQFFDMGDYPMRASEEALFRLVEVYRKT